jgi:hypothetical protein
MDNAMFHKSPVVNKAVEESGNKILYSVASTRYFTALHIIHAQIP